MRRKGRGEIIKISNLFEKYTKNLIAPQGTVIKTFQEVVHDLLGVSIEKTQCSFNTATRTLTVAASGPLKSEILLRKNEILAHLKGRLGEKNAPRELL